MDATRTYIVRTHTKVEAMRFDGTAESASAIAAKFYRLVARSVSRDDVLIIPGFFGFTEVHPGEWITRDELTGAMQSMSQESFDLLHRSISYASKSR